jgi:hypothetical protein
VPGLPAGGRRIVGIASMPGARCRCTGAAQVRRAKDRRRYALRILGNASADSKMTPKSGGGQTGKSARRLSSPLCKNISVHF